MSFKAKEEFIEMTGGFRLNESKEEFQIRSKEIGRLREKIDKNNASSSDIELLTKLTNTSNEYCDECGLSSEQCICYGI